MRFDRRCEPNTVTSPTCSLNLSIPAAAERPVRILCNIRARNHPTIKINTAPSRLGRNPNAFVSITCIGVRSPSRERASNNAGTNSRRTSQKATFPTVRPKGTCCKSVTPDCVPKRSSRREAATTRIINILSAVAIAQANTSKRPAAIIRGANSET